VFSLSRALLDPQREAFDILSAHLSKINKESKRYFYKQLRLVDKLEDLKNLNNLEESLTFFK